MFHNNRTDPSDLEVAVSTEGGRPSQTNYVSYADLSKMPQVTFEISDDTNFKGKTRISGVELESFARALGAAPGSRMVVAICDDGYRANYPADYVRAHHPLLVLRVDDRPPAQWPKSHDGGGLGPYLISHPTFTPSFKILSHVDEPQIPYGVVRLELRVEASVYAAISPRGPLAQNSIVRQGYRIAQQNCFRCHNSGDEGGRMAGRPWLVLGAWAASDPAHFRAYVRNPRAVNASGHMPGNPDYDDATIEALRRYFATFVTRPSE